MILTGISPTFCGELILSFSLIKNSELLFEITPTGFLLSKERIELATSPYVRFKEDIFAESISTIISSSVSP